MSHDEDSRCCLHEDTMSCNTLYEKTETKIGRVFEKHGYFVAKYPIPVILVSVLVSGLLGIGLIRLTIQTDLEKTYTPMVSRAKNDRNKVREMFGEKSGTNYYPQSLYNAGLYGEIIIEAKNGGNILNTTLLKEVKQVYDYIYLQIKVSNASGHLMTYQDICAKRNFKCVVNGQEIFSSTFEQQMKNNNVTYPFFGKTLLKNIFGDVKTFQTNTVKLKSASMIKFRYNLRQDSSEYIKLSKAWEKMFLDKMKSIKTNQTVVSYANSESLDTELNANIGGDIVFFSLTFTLMILYATIATANFRCVADRTHVGRAGVLTVALSILAGFGLVAACGVEFVELVGVMPFLVLGVGLDDMFILLSGLSEASFEKSPEERIAETMRTSGVAITITSLTDIIAFAVGASSVFLSVRNFCIYTAVAIFFVYVNFVTFFPACLALNEKRMQQNRHCCYCHVIPSRQDAENKDIIERMLCSGSPPRSKKEADGFLEWYPSIFFEKIVSNTFVKVMVLIIFAAYLGIAGFGLSKFKQGLVVSNLLREDSYYYKFSQLDECYFVQDTPISFVISTKHDYLDKNVIKAIENAQNIALSDRNIKGSLYLNWLKDYLKSSYFDNSSQSLFIAKLQTQFLPSMPSYINDIEFDSGNTSILASRFYVFANNVRDSQEEGKLMVRMREIADNSPVNMFAYSPSFIFYEQYVAILPGTIKTVGIAVAAVLVITTLFMPHPVMIIYVTVTMVTIMIGLFGFMALWDLTLSSITMIHVIMSVGFSVDYSAHVCHAFMVTDCKNRHEKVQRAIRRAGGPVLNGALSSVMGIIILVASKSYVFRSFFKVMLLVVLFGIFHALFFLPVLLSFSCSKEEKTETDSSSKKSATDIKLQITNEMNCN